MPHQNSEHPPAPAASPSRTERSITDSALVLIGHGSTRNDESAAPVRQLAEYWREQQVFSEVHACFWMVDPNLRKLWPLVRAKTVYIVPITISQGYFTAEVIPKHLGLAPLSSSLFGSAHNIDGKEVHYCPPIGAHPSMSQALIHRAEQIVEAHPTGQPPSLSQMTLFLVGHGTERNQQSRAAVELQVERIKCSRRFHDVQPAFMMEKPFIADCWSATTARNLVVVPFFISDGLHTQEDIPVLLGMPETEVRDRRNLQLPPCPIPLAQGRQRLWYSTALGADPLLAKMILDHVRAARALPPPSSDA